MREQTGERAGVGARIRKIAVGEFKAVPKASGIRAKEGGLAALKVEKRHRHTANSQAAAYLT